MKHIETDKILYTQLIIARMGEKELMNWWNTDIAYEMGGADFLGRLLGITMAPLSAAEGILRAAFLKENQLTEDMPNPDNVCTLFRPEPETAVAIEERLRHFKRYPESLPTEIGEILDPKKEWRASQLAGLIASTTPPEFKKTSFGLEIENPVGLRMSEIMANMAHIVTACEKSRYVLAYYRKG